MNPTVREIVTLFLKHHGYDGLYAEFCGCQIDDLNPCNSDDVISCRAGYKTIITEENQDDYQDFEVGDCVVGEEK